MQQTSLIIESFPVILYNMQNLSHPSCYWKQDRNMPLAWDVELNPLIAMVSMNIKLKLVLKFWHESVHLNIDLG